MTTRDTAPEDLIIEAFPDDLLTQRDELALYIERRGLTADFAKWLRDRREDLAELEELMNQGLHATGGLCSQEGENGLHQGPWTEDRYEIVHLAEDGGTDRFRCRDCGMEIEPHL